mmetsp:Transcript_104049/g.333552  ORF Transcript_104049/g.333552 Transcript_104049/m.333552 type:complete len:226 (+) Transcript_104049:112-789(+)
MSPDGTVRCPKGRQEVQSFDADRVYPASPAPKSAQRPDAVQSLEAGRADAWDPDEEEELRAALAELAGSLGASPTFPLDAPPLLKGQAAHATGTCRPCIFALRGVCKNSDEMCSYCHAPGHARTKRASLKVRQRKIQASSPSSPSPLLASSVGEHQELGFDLPGLQDTAATTQVHQLLAPVLALSPSRPLAGCHDRCSEPGLHGPSRIHPVYRHPPGLFVRSLQL